MVKLVSCPNCGAPLRAANEPGTVECPYCGANLVRESHDAGPRPPFTPSTTPTGVVPYAAVALIGAAALLGAALLAWLAASRSPSSASRAAAPRRFETDAGARAAPARTAPARVSFSRLASLDIRMTGEAAKLAMPREFPEAEADVHRKDYSLHIAHPAFGGGSLSWDWGCNCLSLLRLSFTDYATRLRGNETFVPCLNHELGRPLKSNPPWDYEWDVAKLPVVHLGPQMLFLSPRSEATQAGWKRALAAVDTCGHALAEAPHD